MKCATYMIDKIKLVLALILVAAGVAGFYLLSEHALVVRILAVLAGIIAAVVVFWSTPLGREAFAFVQDSAAEARRVVWPTRKETIQTTVAVFVLVMVMAVFLWLVDIGFLWGVKMLMGRGA
ncbi:MULTISPECIES: preprotein translocase subunit SecE [Methylovorus]|nr:MULTISPECIES: preprotein translocase subunit SecE [Methylovorus]